MELAIDLSKLDVRKMYPFIQTFVDAVNDNGSSNTLNMTAILETENFEIKINDRQINFVISCNGIKSSFNYIFTSYTLQVILEFIQYYQKYVEKNQPRQKSPPTQASPKRWRLFG